MPYQQNKRKTERKTVREWVPGFEVRSARPWDEWGPEHQERVLRESIGEIAFEMIEGLLEEENGRENVLD